MTTQRSSSKSVLTVTCLHPLPDVHTYVCMTNLFSVSPYFPCPHSWKTEPSKSWPTFNAPSAQSLFSKERMLWLLFLNENAHNELDQLQLRNAFSTRSTMEMQCSKKKMGLEECIIF
mmetsp:Transcript_16565/g.31285  ORF Transcript_16565/g.31285 Transcript_16565/m.31285 type:complete len:117 (-) Transcript_16565:130-480(-)